MRLDSRRARGHLVALLLALVVVTFGAASLDQYNVTWDEALGDLFFGERYLSFFTTFDPVYLDVDADPYPPDRRPDLSLSPFRGRPWEYYPVANTLAAATAEISARQLGWLDVFDGYHALNLVLAAIFLLVFHAFLRRRYGLLVATAAIGFLFGHPRVIFHMMANIKDFPLMVFWSLTACAFVVAWERGSTPGLLGCAGLLGLSLGTKANALFFPLLPALVLLVGGVPGAWKDERGSARRLWWTVAVSAVVSLGTMVALWPYLWADPVGRFSRHLEYLTTRRAFTAPGSVAPVFEALLWTTPPIFLLALVVGGAWLARRMLARRRQGSTQRAVDLLWPAWIVASLARYALPQSVNFDGIRHFLEVMPALAVVAGLGAAAAARWTVDRIVAGHQLRRLPRRRVAAAALVALALSPGAWAVLRTHPFQACYWNAFVGGYDGARARDLPQASDYWGASYRLGLRWLDEHAVEDAYLAVPVVEHAVRLVAPQRLRPDIQLLPVTTPFSPRIAPERLAATRRLAEEEPVYVMFVERRDWANELMLDCLRHLEPEVVWQLEGAPVLSIYRYRPP